MNWRERKSQSKWFFIFFKRWHRLKGTGLLPHIVVKHGLYVPRRAESTEAFAKTLVVDGSSVDRKEPHQQNQIAAPKHHLPDLKETYTHFLFHLQCQRHLLTLQHACSMLQISKFNFLFRQSLKFFWITSLLLFLNLGSFSSRTIQRAAIVITMPWPTSPNITANRKGKVMMVNTAVCVCGGGFQTGKRQVKDNEGQTQSFSKRTVPPGLTSR